MEAMIPAQDKKQVYAIVYNINVNGAAFVVEIRSPSLVFSRHLLVKEACISLCHQ